MAYGSSNKYINWQIEVVQGTQEIANNRTYVTVYVKAWRTNTGYTTDGYGRCQLTVNGSAITDNTWSYGDGHALTYNSYTVLHSWSGWIEHNTDGTKTLSVSAYWGIGSSSNNWTSTAHASQTETYSITLTTIPRYFSQTPTLTFSSKTETSITFTWRTSEQCSGISWSRTGTHTGVPGTSGTVTFSGLTANTSYSVYGTFTRSDSGLKTNSASNTQTTYNYPYISGLGVSALTIGNNQTVSLYNPLSRSCTVYMKKDNTSGTQFASTSTSSTSVTLSPNASSMYSSIPNSSSGNCVYYVVCSSPSHTSGTYSGTYVCSSSACAPTLSTASGNLSYKDTNSVTTNITSNDQYIIQSQGNCKVTIANAATAKNGASIASYVVTLGSQSKTVTAIGASNPIDFGTIDSGSSLSLSYYAVDSRGFQSASSSVVTVQMVPWQAPSVAITQLERANGYSPNITLIVTASISPLTIGNTNKNSLITHSYSYIGSDSSTGNGTWTSGTAVPSLTLSADNDYTFTITYADTLSGTKTITRTLPKGVAILMIDPVVEGVGINCFPSAAGLYISGNRVVAITSGTTTPSAASGAIGDIYIQIS